MYLLGIWHTEYRTVLQSHKPKEGRRGSENRMSAPGTRLCEGSNRYIHPTKAKAKDGKWKYIYQRKESKKETQLKPLVYIEECLGVYMKFPYL